MRTEHGQPPPAFLILLYFPAASNSPPVRPRIRADDSAVCADHPGPEGADQHPVVPAIRRQDSLVVAQRARHGERADAEAPRKALLRVTFSLALVAILSMIQIVSSVPTCGLVLCFPCLQVLLASQP